MKDASPFQRPDQLSYGFIRLKPNLTHFGEFATAAGLLVVGFFGMGWPFWEPDLGFRLPPVTVAYWAQYLIPFALGILVGLIALKRMYTLLWLGSPTGEIARGRGGRPNAFEFKFVQKALLPLSADVTSSLVLRETIREVDSERKITERHRDHLAAVAAQEGFRLAAGEWLAAQNRFELPEQGSAGFLVAEWPLSWVVKVLVEVRGVTQFWYEFALPFPVTTGSVEGQSKETGYYVRLLSCPNLTSFFTPPRALRAVAPHLEDVISPPFTVRERMTREESEEVCRRLEAEGGVVELWLGEELVSRSKVHDLPLPTSNKNVGGDSFPIAAQGTPESTQQIELRQKP